MNSVIMKNYHHPVMLHECLDALNIKPDGIYIDLTFGGGGHAEAILEQLTTGKLIAFDQDPDAKSNAAALGSDKLIFIPSNFRYFTKYLRMHKISEVDGILADLGVSSHQIDAAERGFSTRFDGPLDMRMDQQGKLKASDVINTYEEDDLIRVFSLYGEIKNARTLTNAILSFRSGKNIESSGELREIVTPYARRGKENQYLAQVYQALRIEVNGELDALREMLEHTPGALAPKGRLVVMSYHSLEDRLVKYFINTGNFNGEQVKDFYGNLQRPLTPVNRKPITASIDELAANNRARSAKLRIAEK